MRTKSLVLADVRYHIDRRRRLFANGRQIANPNVDDSVRFNQLRFAYHNGQWRTKLILFGIRYYVGLSMDH